MNMTYENNIYIIDSDFHLLDFDKVVNSLYKGVKVGDVCYKKIMDRDNPCPHCPIARNSDNSSIVFFDKVFNEFVEATFCELSDGKFCVTRHKAGVENENIKNQIERSMGFFDAYSSVFVAAYFIEFSTGKYSIFKQEQPIEGVGSHRIMWDKFHSFVRTHIHKDDQEKLIEASRIETMKERLKTEKRYSVIVREIPEYGGRWLRFEVNRSIDDNHAAISIMDVTAEKENDQRLEQMAIVEALSRDFTEISRLDLKNNTSVAIKIKRKMVDYDSRKVRKLSDIWKNYAERYVVPEDRDELIRKTSPEYIRKALETSDMLAIPFRVNYNNELHYCQAKLVTISEDRQQLIMGLRSIDDEVREEDEQRRVLENALAAAEHANNAKTTFLNNMSHDIRTPMNAIIGFTALAATHIDNKEQVADYLKKISVSSEHLLSLINDVLDMSRIESGKVKIEETKVHLPDILHELRTIIQANVAAKHLDLFIDTVDVLNEDIMCDKLRLKQILLNLISNAIKFTKAGGMLSIRIIEKPGAPEGYASYEFRVKDSGIGMSKGFQEHIFEAFTREQSSTISGIQGTGLGMAITKNIVDMMGGTITLNSEVGKGTEFIVCLQFKTCEIVRNEKIPKLVGLHALVADDDFDTCASVSKMLSDIGMRAEWTVSGKEAILRTKLAIENNDEFSAYIIDWMMPDMNGIETVRQIRRIIGNNDKPIIVLTAYDWTDIEEEAREAGVTAFCSKPLFMSELREALIQPIKPAEKKQPAEISVFKGKKILLAEDNALNREIATAILEEAGFSVDTANNGADALEKIKNAEADRYDIVLMDIQMPVMDGYEAALQIRGLDNKKKSAVPIYAMTANAFEEDKQKALDSGMNGHIAKPIDIEKMMKILEEALK